MRDICRACAAELMDDDGYCGTCGTQVRCRRCRGLLKANKGFCTTCGAATGEGPATTPGADAPASQPTGRNVIEYREEKASRYLRAEFTDTTAGNLVGPLSAALGGRLPVPTSRARISSPVERQIIEAETVALPASFPEAGHSALHTVAAVVEPGVEGTTPEDDQLHRVFRYDGGHLQLIETRLKAGSQLDYARRLGYLFLYAHSVAGRDRVPRSELNAALDDAGVLDSNTRRWLRTSHDLLLEDDTLGLRISGREMAQSVLADIVNPELSDKWLPGASKVRTTKSAAAESVTRAIRPGERRRSTTVEGWVSKWNTLNLPVEHAVLDRCSPMDKGLVGLWAIRTADETSGKVVTRGQLGQFLYEAFEIKADTRSIERALKSAKARGRVLAVKGTQFQITPQGMAHARHTAGLPPDQQGGSASEPVGT